METPSFQSFVENDRDLRRSNVESPDSDEFGYQQLGTAPLERPVQLLNGECEAGRWERVTLRRAGGARSIFGKFVATNLRLCFTPASKTERDSFLRRFRWLDEEDELPLCAVHSVHVSDRPLGETLSRKHFRQLHTSLSALDIVSVLMIFGKDMRVWVVDLHQSQNAVSLANHILHFSKPSGPADLPQLKAAGLGAGGNEVDWSAASSWRAELSRCGFTTRTWRAVDLKHLSIRSMHPNTVVVATGAQLTPATVEAWHGGRFPIWMWGEPGGIGVLLRSSIPRNEETRKEENDDSSSQRTTRPSAWSLFLPPGVQAHTMQVNDTKLSPGRVAAAFEAMIELCCVDSWATWTQTDRTFLRRLGASGWPMLLLDVIRTAQRVLYCVVEKRETVVLAGTTGALVECVVGALVELMGDRQARTLNGFLAVVAKHWTAEAHPFFQQIFGYREERRPSAAGRDSADEEAAADPSGRCTPFFLLFLDAVWQLWRMNRSAFEFSPHLLIGLWDATLSGVPENLYLGAKSLQLHTIFSRAYRDLFFNAHWCTGVLTGDPLRTPKMAADIAFWDQCYTRWLPFANSNNGGDVLLASVIETRTRIQQPAARILLGDTSNAGSLFPYARPSAKPDPALSSENSNSADSALENGDDVGSTQSLTEIGRREGNSREIRTPRRERFGSVDLRQEAVPISTEIGRRRRPSLLQRITEPVRRNLSFRSNSPSSSARTMNSNTLV